MKLSEQLGNPETRTKKRKRELVSDDKTIQSEDYTNTKHPTKKNKKSAFDQDYSNEAGDNHRFNDEDIYNSDNQHEDETDKGIKTDLGLKNKKSQESSSIELTANSTNRTAESLNSVRNQSAIDDGRVSLKKSRKQENNTNPNSVINSDFPANSAKNLPQIESNFLKKNKKERKLNKINDENPNEMGSLVSSNSPITTDINFEICSERANVTDETNESTEPRKIFPKRRKNRKNKHNADSNESELISSSGATKTINTEFSLNLPTDALSDPIESPEDELPRRLSKKKRKLDKNCNIATPHNDASESVSTSNLQLNPSENVSIISDFSAKPLKSCLKKKKHKNKKKTNKRSNDNSFEDEKKLSNRSVSFDNNVKIELIENCLSKSTAQETKNTAVNARKKIRALNYLKRWKEDRQNWKFEKLTQLWLLKNMFNEVLVPREDFDYLLEYIVGLEGAARILVDDLCKEVITKMEQKVAEEQDKELEATYSRARSVLQYLQMQ